MTWKFLIMRSPRHNCNHSICCYCAATVQMPQISSLKLIQQCISVDVCHCYTLFLSASDHSVMRSFSPASLNRFPITPRKIEAARNPPIRMLMKVLRSVNFSFITISTAFAYIAWSKTKSVSFRFKASAFCLHCFSTSKTTSIFVGDWHMQGGPKKSPYFSLTITFTIIRKPSRFFLHKSIEFFWCKPL